MEVQILISVTLCLMMFSCRWSFCTCWPPESREYQFTPSDNTCPLQHLMLSTRLWGADQSQCHSYSCPPASLPWHWCPVSASHHPVRPWPNSWESESNCGRGSNSIAHQDAWLQLRGNSRQCCQCNSCAMWQKCCQSDGSWEGRSHTSTCRIPLCLIWYASIISL